METKLFKPQTQTTALAVRPSAISAMASRLQVEPAKLVDSLKATVFKGATNEELLSLVVVSNEYALNPFLREIYAFPKKGGGIAPVVGVDGWTKIVNRQENYDGCRFEWEFGEDGKPVSCTCEMAVKSRSHPVVVTEFLTECERQTEPWRTMPRRMLRHRAFIQAARLAFGIGGIYEEDEFHGNYGAGTVMEQPIPRGRVGRPPKTAVVDVLPPDQSPTPSEPEKRASEPPSANDSAAESAMGLGPEMSPAQKALCEFLTDAGVSFGDFAGWCASTGRDKNSDTWSGWEAVPEALCQSLQTDAAGLAKCVKLFGGQAQ